MAASAESTKTIAVVTNVSRRVGHVILRASDRTSRKNFTGFTVAIIYSDLIFIPAPKGCSTKFQADSQGTARTAAEVRRDSVTHAAKTQSSHGKTLHKDVKNLIQGDIIT